MKITKKDWNLYSASLFVWRFQPFHKWHIDAIRQILNESKKLLIVIGSSNNTWTEKNPLNNDIRLKLIKDSLSKEAIDLKRFEFLVKLLPLQYKKIEPEDKLITRMNNPPKVFVDFFNKARPLTTRMHQLELLPGLGKKHMWQIIEERKGDPFKDFTDLKKRVKLLPDPEKVIFKRIMSEITGKEKYQLFVD